MPSNLDTPETTEFMHAFAAAWTRTLDDYRARRINGEHCLQAILYCHLIDSLPKSYRVFVEAVVRLGESGTGATGKKKVVIDLIVETDAKIVAGIELKFTPRGEPLADHIRKDLTSLAFLTSRRSIVDRVAIEVPRFRSADIEVLTLSVLPQRKLIFAAYCKEEATNLNPDTFWGGGRVPVAGYWKNRTALPPNFGVALARTTDRPEIHAQFYGPPFIREGLATDNASEA